MLDFYYSTSMSGVPALRIDARPAAEQAQGRASYSFNGLYAVGPTSRQRASSWCAICWTTFGLRGSPLLWESSQDTACRWVPRRRILPSGRHTSLEALLHFCTSALLHVWRWRARRPL